MKSFKMETMKNISLAALLMASALFTACSGSDDDIISEQSATQTAPKVYTLTIEATKGGDEAATRALTLKNHSLKNTWATSDKVYVYNETKKAMLEGYLTPLIEGKNTTTLSGELTGSVEADDLLILFTPSAIMDYTQQDGTLQYISDNCNYSMASTSVTTVASNGAISTNTPGEFKPLQAVVKFTLLDKSGAPINATTLTINALSNNGSCLLQKGPYSNGVYPTLINGPITLTHTSQTDNVFFAAINLTAASNVTYELTATDANGNTYGKTTTDDSFTVGYYYEVTVKMAKCAPAAVEAVDLGLSVKWATMNVGTTAVGQQGNFFAWGETTGYPHSTDHAFSIENNQWYENDIVRWTKYYTKPGSDYDYTTLQSDDDAATANWGDSWRTPTKDEWAELLDENNCTWTWQDDYDNGAKGWLITSKKDGYTDKSIFLPLTGQRSGESYYYPLTGYWSSTLYTDTKENSYAWYMKANYNAIQGINTHEMEKDQRRVGMAIRPVKL